MPPRTRASSASSGFMRLPIAPIIFEDRRTSPPAISTQSRFPCAISSPNLLMKYCGDEPLAIVSGRHGNGLDRPELAAGRCKLCVTFAAGGRALRADRAQKKLSALTLVAPEALATEAGRFG